MKNNLFFRTFFDAGKTRVVGKEYFGIYQQCG